MTNLSLYEFKDSGGRIDSATFTPSGSKIRLDVNSVIGDGLNPNLGAFGRLRVEEPYTLFDSKMLFDERPLLWDDRQVSGASTTSTFNRNQASVSIAVGSAIAGKRVRQTYQTFNYQPGKSQLIFMTGILGKHGQGIKAGFGQFDDKNGYMLRSENGSRYFGIRSYTSGVGSDTLVLQSNWNIDRMDGTGPSGINLDFDKAQIFVFDYEWLGVGRARMGFVVGGMLHYAHEFNHANLTNMVYTSVPNLPIRYEIENTGTGLAGSVVQICSTIMSEGGQEKIGIVRSISNNTTPVDANVVGSLYPLIGLRLNGSYIGTTVEIEKMSIISRTNDDFQWKLVMNPTMTGTGSGSFTYINNTGSSAVQYALGSDTMYLSGGIQLDCGYVKQNSVVSETLRNALKLGANILGSSDEIILAVMPFSATADYCGALTWRELS